MLPVRVTGRGGRSRGCRRTGRQDGRGVRAQHREDMGCSRHQRFHRHRDGEAARVLDPSPSTACDSDGGDSIRRDCETLELHGRRAGDASGSDNTLQHGREFV